MSALERRQALFWLGALGVLLLALDLLSGILLPFVAGCGIAYFLNPAVDWLEVRRVPRALAAALVLFAFFLVLVVLLLLMLPLLELEAGELVRQLPAALTLVRQEAQTLVESARQRLAPDDLAKLEELAGGSASAVAGWAARLLQGVLTSGLALANLLSLVVVTPIVAFFLLRDWEKLLARIDRWLPRRYEAVIREQARLVDAALAGLVHGQVLVGLTLIAYYGVALSLIGLHYAVILAIIVGVLSIVPYLGVATGLVLALGLGLAQYGPSPMLLAVLGVFAVGHAGESNILSPRLVARRVNLHPVWVIFALLAFGALFGFLGVLLALPAAAVIGVLVRFALSAYLASPLYDPANRPPAG